MDSKCKVDAMCNERSNLRQEIIGFEHSSSQAMFGFYALVGALAGVYWKPELIKDEATKNIILFLISQIQFSLAVFVLTLSSVVQVEVGYIAALEEKINTLCNDTIAIWESRICREYIVHRRAPFLWGTVLQTFLMIVLFVTTLGLSIWKFSHTLTAVMILVELAIVIALLVFGVIRGRQSSNSARKYLGLSNERTLTHLQPAQQSASTSQQNSK
jgi:hypothetical protein